MAGRKGSCGCFAGEDDSAVDASDRDLGWAPFDVVPEIGGDLGHRSAKLVRKIVPGGEVGW